MALKKLPKDMSYEAVRYKHPPTPNHAPPPPPVEGLDAGKAIELTDTLRDDHAIPTADRTTTIGGAPVEPKQGPAQVDRPQGEQEAASRPAAERRQSADENVRVRGYVHVPAIGDHPEFDELRDIYGEKEALAVALSRGMASYEMALRDTVALERAPRPDRRSRRVEASRTMPHNLYLKAVTHLDPKAMLGRSQIGSRILGVALTRFLEEK